MSAERQMIEINPADDKRTALPAVLTPMDMIQRAVEQNAGIETLEKLMALQERYERNQARRAFDNALAAAKSEIPVIYKNRQVGFASKKAGAARTDYKHEDLAEIARTIDPILAKHGLSYRFRPSVAPNEPVKVTCIISHRGGHSEESTLSAGRDDSGNKNSIQQVGSTITYLSRYTLKAALGLSASSDDDGAASEAPPVTAISGEQVKAILDLIEQTGTDIEQFCRAFTVEAIIDLSAADYDRAVGMLNRKAARK